MKYLVYCLTVAFFPLAIFADDCRSECETYWTMEVRGAYYQPTSKQLRKVFSSSLIDYQVTISKRTHRFCEFWAEIDWTIKSGHAHKHEYGEYYGFKDRTRLSLLPTSVGFNLIYPIFSCVDVYAGAGVSYSILRIKNKCKEDYAYWGIHDSPFKKVIYKYGFGGLFKVGFQVAMSDTTYLDFFADYFSQRFHFSKHEDREGRSVFKHELDCSGFKFGAGFGVYF